MLPLHHPEGACTRASLGAETVRPARTAPRSRDHHERFIEDLRRRVTKRYPPESPQPRLASPVGRPGGSGCGASGSRRAPRPPARPGRSRRLSIPASRWLSAGTGSPALRTRDRNASSSSESVERFESLRSGHQRRARGPAAPMGPCDRVQGGDGRTRSVIAWSTSRSSSRADRSSARSRAVRAGACRLGCRRARRPRLRARCGAMNLDPGRRPRPDARGTVDVAAAIVGLRPRRQRAPSAGRSAS